jgi:hypothetical protein
MVPDVRWFSVGKGLATRLARAQLSPPPAYLKGAARSDVPVGTRLTVDAVPVEAGVATVDLTATKPGGDPLRRQNLWAQFVATLTQIPEVNRVALRVEGSTLDVPGVEQAPASLGELGFPPAQAPVEASPVLRTGGQLFTVDPGRLGDERDFEPSLRPAGTPSIPTGWVWLAVSHSGDEIAAVGGNRAELARWRGGRQGRVPSFGTRLTRPAYDGQDVLWVAGKAGGRAQVWAVTPAADPADAERSRPTSVDVGWLEGRTIVALRVAPDGQRLAIASTTESGQDPRVDVAGVVRSTNGMPERLAEPVEVGPALTLVRDLVWVDQTRLAVLGRINSTAPVRAWIAEVGGRMVAVEVSDVPGAQAITTINGERGLVVTTDDRRILLRAGSSWLEVADRSDFAVPAT